jgi:hypothetical protein
MNPFGYVLDELTLMEMALQIVQFTLAVVGLVAVVVCGTAARCCLCELFGASPKDSGAEFLGLGESKRSA